MEVTVCVATYGPPAWETLALRRAVPSAQRLGANIIARHEPTGGLDVARNRCLELVESPWVCFLDADDELEPGFFAHMRRGTADVRAPSVRYVRGGTRATAKMPRVAGHTHACSAECLPFGNWLVIGSVARTELLRDVGGFRDFEVYEDWDIWVRCHLAGASIEAVPRAVYRAHVRRGSRNRLPSQSVKHAAHQAIARANGLPVPP